MAFFWERADLLAFRLCNFNLCSLNCLCLSRLVFGPGCGVRLYRFLIIYIYLPVFFARQEFIFFVSEMKKHVLRYKSNKTRALEKMFPKFKLGIHMRGCVCGYGKNKNKKKKNNNNNKTHTHTHTHTHKTHIYKTLIHMHGYECVCGCESDF